MTSPGVRRVKRKSPQGISMTERELSQSIIHAARECGWLVARTWLSKFSPAGEPDLRMLKNGKAAVWELKGEHGKVLPAQQTFLDEWAKVPGVDVRVVRPADIESAYRFLAGIEEEKP